MAPWVLDASVLIKWVVPADNEAHVEQACAIRNEIVWRSRPVVLPSLWFYEVGNTLARRFPEHVQRLMSDLLDMRFQEAQVDSLLPRALELTRRYGVTFYDACYHATALVHGGTLITSDQRYLAQVSGADGIVALADWSRSTQ